MTYAEEVEKMTFEESIKTLEDLVKELEAGGIDLDRSIEIYEKAVLLRNHCRQILDESERRIQKIMESSGTLKTEDLKFE
ncbi:MAG: exodeoxyribonuclease VII small subunit [Candidatus Methanomethylophilaceae archaeon]|nr:exodeoxyribonuclease VII small subunit [Candidatus Methanomethylophilaceae archaeon]MBQ9689470.1 exodeoxyribonuclease VII small subunit [Candidatus Methanomethylophilaceae archaeon]MBR4202127.1 exodeoxyribonuclease VII small subunit [Candidatus Methanomethylophilaceae archaeon]MBR6911833.1 exodeoxyribonuclease VII small subunit [Candidatus Methanomethylophilaceae archaeon]